MSIRLNSGKMFPSLVQQRPPCQGQKSTDYPGGQTGEPCQLWCHAETVSTTQNLHQIVYIG